MKWKILKWWPFQIKVIHTDPKTRLCSLFLPQQLHIRPILTEKCGYQWIYRPIHPLQLYVVLHALCNSQQLAGELAWRGGRWRWEKAARSCRLPFWYVCKAVQTAVSESASPKRFGFFCLLVFMSERQLVHLFMTNDIFMHTTAAEVKSRFGSTAQFYSKGLILFMNHFERLRLWDNSLLITQSWHQDTNEWNRVNSRSSLC